MSHRLQIILSNSYPQVAFKWNTFRSAALITLLVFSTSTLHAQLLVNSQTPKLENERSNSQTAQTDPSQKESESKTEPIISEVQETQETSKSQASQDLQETREITTEKENLNGRVPIRQRAPGRLGAIGLAEVLSADTGPQGTIRFGFQFGGFTSDEFLTPGVEERFLSTRAHLGYTPHDLVETFLSARSISHTNPLSSPTTIQSQGDVNVGAKTGMFWGNFGAGFALDLLLLSAPDGGWNFGATSVNLHGLLSYDLNRGEAPIPFRFLFHTQYTIDRSEALFDDLPELPNLIQEWAYQAGYYNRLYLRFGIEAPFEQVSPFVEYHMGTPFEVEMPRMGKYSRVFAFESIPQSINLGVRGFFLEHFNADLVATLGMSDAPFTGVPATPPWALWATLNYSLDPRPKILEREVKVTPPPPPVVKPKPLGTLLSFSVVDQATKTVIEGAKVTYLDHKDKASQSSDAQGLITGYRFTEKAVNVEVSAENYISRKLSIPIITEDKPLRKLVLKPNPQFKLATVQISLNQSASVGEDSQELPEELRGQTFECALYGPENHKESLAFGAQAMRISLKPGEYVLQLSLEGKLKYHQVIQLAAGGEIKRVITPQDFLEAIPNATTSSTSSKPSAQRSTKRASKAKPQSQRSSSNSLVNFNRSRGSLSTKQMITFKGDSSTLSTQGIKVTDALATFLQKERAIKVLTLLIHTHNIGSPETNKQLGNQRGDAIRKRLTQRGVSNDRIKVVSYGNQKAVASNLTSSGRQKNQRILFNITLKD